MKNSILFILILVATAALSPFIPWWIIALIAFMGTYVSKTKAAEGFSICFLAVFLAWLGSILMTDDGTIAVLMGKLLNVSSSFTPFLASLLGGLVAGFFGLAGSLLSPKTKNWVND